MSKLTLVLATFCLVALIGVEAAKRDGSNDPFQQIVNSANNSNIISQITALLQPLASGVAIGAQTLAQILIKLLQILVYAGSLAL